MKQPSTALIALLLVSEPLFAAELRFSEPVPLSAIINDENGNGGPSMSSEGLALNFASHRPGGYGFGDTWVSRRSSATDPWGPPTNLAVVSRGRETALTCLCRSAPAPRRRMKGFWLRLSQSAKHAGQTWPAGRPSPSTAATQLRRVSSSLPRGRSAWWCRRL